MELRPHQIKAVEMLRASLRKGKKKPILAAPCSFGKTITAAYILHEAAKKGKRGIFICDRVKLIEQALSSFDHHGLDFGVIQGLHERTDITRPIQIASIQTLARRREFPIFDIAIVDECHTHYDSLTKMMETYNAVPFIGLSATPFSKGLGRHYDDLIVPITPSELLEQGYLCPVHYYGGKKADITGVKRKGLSTGGSDYDVDGLSDAYEKDMSLVGDIIANWRAHADGMQTIAFSPSIKHSKYMVQMFNEAGIPAEHIDGYMDPEEREWLYEAHDNGEFKILSCSRLLNTGYDAPKVRCLIDCFPTASKIIFSQRAGRVMRTAEDKPYAVYLDHAGNIRRHGFAEHIVAESLDDGEQRFSESNQLKEKKEPDVKACPECYQEMVGIRCKACGYEIPITKQMKTDNQILERLNAQAKSNKTYTSDQKSYWLGELYLYASDRGFSTGWAAHKYKSKFGVWPNKIKPAMVNHVSDEVRKWITRENIRFAAMREKHELRNNS